jgi:methanogenic corrinoid protein MtbC1
MKTDIAAVVNEEFFHRHPEWFTRFGVQGKQRGFEDICYHLDFLAGAVESGVITAFEEYVRWTAHLLARYAIAPHFIAEILQLIESTLASHLASEDRSLLGSYLEAGCAVCGEPETGKDEVGLALIRRVFLQAILGGHRQAALNIVMAAHKEGYTVPDIYLQVFQEALYEIGRLWEGNRISVAVEHRGTAITQYVIAQLYQNMMPNDVRRGAMVITGIKGELHQVGANMVADMFEADGWDVRFLGANVPPEGVVAAVREHNADVVGISTTMMFNIPQVVELVESVRREFGAQAPRILLGGSAFRAAPTLPEELNGCDVALTIQEALALTRK